MQLLGVPADWLAVLYSPWTLFTYMFTHFSFWHLLFNMLWLYWFGTFFLNYFSARQFTAVYIAGGLAGALLYIVAYNVLPAFAIDRFHAIAVGASASIMAIVFAVCFYLPNHRIYLFLLGSFKLIHLALFTVLIDIVSAMSSNNAGGHIAHIGGALLGIIFVIIYRYNLKTGSLNGIFAKLFRSNKPKLKFKRGNSAETDYEYKRQDEDDVNRILDKISRSGYDSLTREEKKILFKSGKS
jgi:membrane associated rhomboid family serine protease